MDLRAIAREFGRGAQKWVWTARPAYVFEADGSEQSHLRPVAAVLPQHFDDDNGWWTCHRDTRVGDLAVIYRSSGRRERDHPIKGPQDIAYVCLATSDAFSLADDPIAVEEGFERLHGCNYVVLARIEPPLTLSDLRADPVVERWPAMRAGFVQAAMPVPEPVWDRLIEIGSSGRSIPRPTPIPGELKERAEVERELEDWLVENLEVLKPVGYDLTLVRRQAYLVDHEGKIDVLCRRRGNERAYVVVELKVGEVRRDAAAQLLGYMGWLRARPDTDSVAGLLIGGSQDSQLPYVLAEIGDKVSWLAWNDIDLPQRLSDRVAMRADG